MKKENNKTGTAREPFVRIVKKNLQTNEGGVKVRVLSFLFALVICFAFILIVGKGEISLGRAVSSMWKGAFGIMGNSKSMSISVWDTAIFTAKLLCVAVALAPAFKMKFWNIGAEGQMIVGGLVAGIFMHNCVGLFKTPFGILLSVVCGILAGALWGLIPAFCKAQWGTNETLFTLMMNYVAMKIMDYFYNDWKGMNSALPNFDKSTWLPSVFGHTYTINIIVFVALAVLMYFYLKKTKQGYEIAVVGESQNTARYAGINVKWVILRTMAISGAVCGLCGALTVLGQNHTVSYSGDAVHALTSGYGFTAIIVAWLANFNTIGMILFSLLIIFLKKGTGQLGNEFPALSTGADNVLVGVMLFCIIGGAFFLNYKLVFCERVAAPCRRFSDKFLAPVGRFFSRIGNAVKGIFKKKKKEQEADGNV